MSVLEASIRIATLDGELEAFVAAPDPAAPAPSLLILGDAPGLRGALRDVARDFCRRGFFTVVPDLYYRRGVLRFRPPLGAAERARIEPARRELTVARFADDARAIVARLECEPAAESDRLLVAGLCIGSGFALACIAALGSRVAGAALIDGCELSDRDGSPQRFREPVRTRIFVAQPTDAETAFAEALRALLARQGAPFETEPVAGVAHGFCFPDWPGGVFDSGARERVFARAAAFLAGARGADAAAG